MLFYVALSLFFPISMLVLLSKFCSLEATDDSGAALLLDGGSVGISQTITAVLYGKIKIHFSQGADTSISIPSDVYRTANACHPPLAQDWGEAVDAAISSTKQAIQQLKHSTGPDEDTHLYPFIKCITLMTFLHLFIRVPITPTNVQEVTWIVEKSWQTGGCCQDIIEDPAELHRLLKSSPNPSGILPLLVATQRLVLSGVCLLEHQKGTITFLRQARVLLENPTSSGSEVTRRIEKLIQSHPPVQSIHGKVSLGRLPFHRTYNVDFFIPIEALPQSVCLVGPDGACASWIHKATLPGQPACNGRAWLTHATAIILSAIETEIRQAGLTIDKDEHDPNAWEDWVLRRLRVR